MKTVPVAKLRGFSGGNPKTPKEGELQKLDGSLEDHGYVVPVLVRELDDAAGTYELIDGHSRVTVILERDPQAKIKVIVLDVESVAEGRRVLLAIQGQVGFDMSKLDDFAQAALSEGATVAELMRDTGMTGADLSAFAAAGTEFLDGLAGGGSSDDEDKDEKDDEADKDNDLPNDGPSRAGLTTEHVAFGVPLTRKQAPIVQEAIKLAKGIAGVKVAGDALTAICAFYLEQKKEQGGEPARKSKGKSKKKARRR